LLLTPRETPEFSRTRRGAAALNRIEVLATRVDYLSALLRFPAAAIAMRYARKAAMATSNNAYGVIVLAGSIVKSSVRASGALDFSMNCGRAKRPSNVP